MASCLYSRHLSERWRCKLSTAQISPILNQGSHQDHGIKAQPTQQGGHTHISYSNSVSVPKTWPWENLQVWDDSTVDTSISCRWLGKRYFPGSTLRASCREENINRFIFQKAKGWLFWAPEFAVTPVGAFWDEKVRIVKTTLTPWLPDCKREEKWP